MRGIDYIVEECPNAAGASQLVYKDVLNRLENASPGTKHAFVKEFLRTGQPAFAGAEERGDSARECAGCGMPSWGELCAFCGMMRAVQTRAAARAAAAGPTTESAPPA
jgi:tRNA(Ile)-lysidine synthase TilS/MesJ